MMGIKICKPSVVLFFIVGLFTVAAAQPVRIHTFETGCSLMCSQDDNISKGQNGCRMIYELAVPRAKNPKKSTIDYNFRVSIERNEHSDTGQLISGQIFISGISDLKQYEGFDMGGFLTPSKACLKASNGQYNKEIDVFFSDSVAGYSLFIKGDHPPETPSISIIRPEFDEARVERFMDGLIMVRDYLALAGLVEDLQRESELRYQDPWQEATAIIWFSHAGQLTGNMGVWSAHEIYGQDPRNIELSMKAIGIEAYRRQLAFIREGQSGQLSIQPFSQASVAWLGDQIEWLISHKENSNPYSTAFISRLATIGSESAWGGLHSHLTEVWPSENIEELIKMLKPFLNAQAIDLNQRAKEKITNEKFGEAMLFASNALSIAGQSDNEELATQANQLISTAHHGILNAWLTIAQRALQTGSFGMAGQYIQKAAAYQQANHEAILSDEALNQTIECYIDSSLHKATRLLQSGKYTDAISRIDDATGYLKRLPFYSQRSQLEFILSQACTKQYERNINQALEWLDNNKRLAGSDLLYKTVDFRISRQMWVTQREEEKLALRLISLYEADSLLDLALNSDTTQWHNLYRLSDRATALLDTIAPVQADTVKWKLGSFTVNQMLRAEREFNNSLVENNYQQAHDQHIAIRYRLRNYIAVTDPLHAETLSEIGKRTSQNACLLADNWGKTLTDAAYDAAIARQFKQAFGLVLKAREIYRDAARCGPDTTAMYQISSRYQEVWLFLRQIARVDSLLMQNHVEEAVAWFDLCRTDYERNFMKLIDMPAPRLENYLLQYPSPTLIDIVMERSLYKISTSELIAIFESMRKHNVPADLLKNWLPELGNVMASDYHQAGKDAKTGSYFSVFKTDRVWYKPSTVRFINNVSRSWFERKWMQLGMMF